MEARSASSDLISATTSDHRRASYLLSLVLSLRRPARPTELAARCALFPASPELILYLCSIPNSPISLTIDLLVVPSPVAVRAIDKSVASSDFADVVSMQLRKRKRNLGVSDCGFELPRKRRLILSSEEGEELNQAQLELQCTSQSVCFGATEYTERSIDRIQCCIGQIVNGLLFAASLSGKSSVNRVGCQLTNVRLVEGETPMSMLRTIDKDLMECEPDPRSAVSISRLENLPVPGRVSEDWQSTGTGSNFMPMFCSNGPEERNISMLKAGNSDLKCRDPSIRVIEEETATEDRVREKSVASCNILAETDAFSQPYDTGLLDVPHCDDEPEKVNRESNEITLVETEALPQAAKVSIAQKQTPKSSPKMKNLHVNVTSPRLKELCMSLEFIKAIDNNEKHRSKGDCKLSDKKKKLREKNDGDLHTREINRSSSSIPAKDQTKQILLPKFESYVVEEEEGSGGYGTVYRARRKKDGTTVAIKCPHAKAHKHHVYNEQRMLERFGGTNFIIKYEGSIKNGDSDCFVLEHVEHDRPEILKKEIDVVQLQWYGYCMFRALVSLHKQGIVHRDVKPGNFLFSRKASQGYLIDFNLAMDLFQNSGNRNDGKSKEHCDVPINDVKLSNEKSIQTKDRKLPNARSLEADNPTYTEGHKSKVDMKNIRRNTLARTNTRNNDIGSWNINKSQGADGSGITSAERMREPLPRQGRKELLSLVQKVRQSQNHETSSSILSPMRKRVVAPSQSINNTLSYLTPMPVVSKGISFHASHLVNKGNGKSKRDGPCAGTKGFRAPEVLFRSLFQGPKVDIWSAGVTLLYLMIGRTPFFGDPEQNIKDVAKLRGSEDLWEIAKLHNRETSFPKELYKTDSLPSTKLVDWCETNTKRPDFFKEMPRSLVDLVDKCLTVNPRLRITAEEALEHEFFAPCHEVLRKQRMQRQVLNHDAENSSLHGKSILKHSKVSQVKM